jgi:hypothetical protein
MFVHSHCILFPIIFPALWFLSRYLLPQFLCLFPFSLFRPCRSSQVAHRDDGGCSLSVFHIDRIRRRVSSDDAFQHKYIYLSVMYKRVSVSRDNETDGRSLPPPPDTTTAPNT